MPTSVSIVVDYDAFTQAPWYLIGIFRCDFDLIGILWPLARLVWEIAQPGDSFGGPILRNNRGKRFTRALHCEKELIQYAVDDDK